jgi:EAL domain-containing protein (putative c-di-GMP-specific phosphodiesterase class I)
MTVARLIDIWRAPNSVADDVAWSGGRAPTADQGALGPNPIAVLGEAVEEVARRLAADVRDHGREAEIAKAVVHTVHEHSLKAGSELSIHGLARNLDALADEAMFKLTTFRRLVHDGEFQPAFQPVVDLETGEAHHFEALVRFDPGAYNLKPYEFITFAESIGLIHEFDLAMCRKVLDFLESGAHLNCVVAVNLSAGSLESPTFIASLLELLRRRDPVRRRLGFEVTETAKIADLATVNAFIQGLRREGHIVCLDDFGAGSAAFQYLRALQVDAVKIDGGYIKNARATSEGARFLKAMTWLIHELDIDTIAEMVEDEDHLAAIKSCNILFGQGYLFGKPSTKIESFGDYRTLVA